MVIIKSSRARPGHNTADPVVSPLPHVDTTEVGRAVAIDSTALATGGGAWHNTHRAQGVMPHASIDTKAGWSKSGWHGWWYGWKLHVAVTVGSLWSPVAAELTVANRGTRRWPPGC